MARARKGKQQVRRAPKQSVEQDGGDSDSDTGEKRPQGRQNAFSGSKLEWLDSQKDGYTEASNHRSFYTRTATLFIDRFGYSLGIEENPPDDVDMKTLVPLQVDTTMPYAEYMAETTRRKEYYTTLRAKLANWYRHRYGVKSLNETLINKLIDGLLANAKHRPPRKRCTRNVYCELFWERKLKAMFEVHWESVKAGLKDSEKLATQNAFVSDCWDKEDEKNRKEVHDAVEGHHAAEVEIWKKKAKVKRTPEGYQEAWDLVKGVFPSLADALGEWLGACVLITAVCPGEGNMLMNSAQSNTERGQVKEIMAEYNQNGWSAFQKMSIQYGQAYFSVEECYERDLRDKTSKDDPTKLDGLLSMDSMEKGDNGMAVDSETVGVEDGGGCQEEAEEMADGTCIGDKVISHDSTPPSPSPPTWPTQPASPSSPSSPAPSGPEAIQDAVVPDGGLLSELQAPLDLNQVDGSLLLNWQNDMSYNFLANTNNNCNGSFYPSNNGINDLSLPYYDFSSLQPPASYTPTTPISQFAMGPAPPFAQLPFLPSTNLSTNLLPQPASFNSNLNATPTQTAISPYLSILTPNTSTPGIIMPTTAHMYTSQAAVITPGAIAQAPISSQAAIIMPGVVAQGPISPQPGVITSNTATQTPAPPQLPIITPGNVAQGSIPSQPDVITSNTTAQMPTPSQPVTNTLSTKRKRKPSQKALENGEDHADAPPLKKQRKGKENQTAAAQNVSHKPRSRRK